LGPLSIGVAANVALSSLSSTQATDPGVQLADSNREGRTTLDVRGVHGAFAAGALLEAVPNRLWIGLSYQSQPALGVMRMDGTLRSTFQGAQSSLPVTVEQGLPDIVRLGGRLRVSRYVETRVSGEFTRWSVLKSQCIVLNHAHCDVDASGASPTGVVIQNIDRHWQDTWSARVGVSIWLTNRIELLGGVTAETAAVPDQTLRPDLPDANSIAPSLGARFDLGGRWWLAASYTHVQFLDRDNTGKSNLASAQLPTKWPDGGGQYAQWIGLLDLNVEKDF
ncbi:MAG: outer membrane protein transport protein, partial [Myxococcota bacterium]|nr:outer membrane protein transport protein [Myxococcota bacterium]